MKIRYLIQVSGRHFDGTISHTWYSSETDNEVVEDACIWKFKKEWQNGDLFNIEIQSVIDLTDLPDGNNVSNFIKDYKQELKDFEENERKEYKRLHEKYG